jgi:glycogen debranching enzyme
MRSRLPQLALLEPHEHIRVVSRGRSVLATQPNGFLEPGPGYGLFVHQTRMLSLYRYKINGRAPEAVNVSNVEQHSSLGYYVASSPRKSKGSRKGEPHTEKAIEMRLMRTVGEGFHEDVDLTNYTQELQDFELRLEVGADFAGQRETKGKRKQHGTLTRAWSQPGPGVWELAFDYHAEHHYEHQGDVGDGHIHRGLTLRIERADSPPSYEDGRLTFRVRLAPRAGWHACVSALAFLEGKPLPLPHGCEKSGSGPDEYERKRRAFVRTATGFTAPGSGTLGPLVAGALEQAKYDLAALRLYDLDQGSHSWTVAAGLPEYVAVFGRDMLIAAWQAGPLGPDLMRGVLATLPRWQGARVDDWRDEQPGRMIHQVQDAPLSALNYNPLGRYYGTVSSPVFYSEVLYGLWLWTGDRDLVRRFVDPAVAGLRWLDEYGDPDGDGFCEYQTHSEQGLKNQGWKDSGQSMVYPDGSQVPTPIGTAEMQGLAYIARVHLAAVLRALDRDDEARPLERAAEELKKRFNDVFWMEDEGTYALGRDPDNRLIRTVCSDAGACLAAAIVDESRARRVADRLLAEDLYSGWGVRTLSTRNPAYNPFSYQRGSVWPVENGIIALAFMRYGLHEHVQRLCRGLFEAAALFEHHRLPEVFAGHPRDAAHPFPGLYPQANWPQAWSASAVFSLVQALLGLFPYAPLNVLVVDPQLPDWLPELTLENLHVGPSVATLRFYRTDNGASAYEVLDETGGLHVVRQPSPWSLTAGLGERLEDALLSLLPGK